MDKIRIETMCLDSLAMQLKQLSCDLTEASSALKGLSIERISGAQVHCQISPVHLTLTNAHIYENITPILIRHFSSALNGTADAATRLSSRTCELIDMFIDCEHSIIRRINAISADSNDAGSPTGIIRAKRKREALEQTLRMLDDAVPPDQLPSVQSAEKLKNDWLYQGAEWVYSIVTGDSQNANTSDRTRKEYLFDSMLAGCVDGEVPFIQASEITGDLLARITDEIGLDMSILQLIADVEGIGDLSQFAEKAGSVAGYTGIAVENFVSCVNQLIVLNAMDKGAVMSMAAAYKNVSDPDMREIGRAVEKLINSSKAEQVAFITGKGFSSAMMDASEKAAFDAIKNALGSNLHGKVWTATADITGAVMDKAVNAGSYAEKSNALIYSSDAVQAMYDGFQKDYDAYKSNPTDDNLSRAVNSYKAYKRTVANSFDALADYTQTATDSAVGQLFTSDSAKNADEIAHSAAAYHRDGCGDIDIHFNEYKSVKG